MNELDFKYFLGLDLSLSNSGLCLIDEKGSIEELNNIKTERINDLPNDRFKRYNIILDGIKGILTKYSHLIPVIAIENYAYSAKGKVIQLVEGGSIVRNFLYDKFLIIEVAPISAKKFILDSKCKEAKGPDAKLLICREIFKKYGIDIDEGNRMDAFVLSQIALLYYKLSNNLNIEGYQKYQLEVVENLLKKESKEKKIK